MKSALDLVREKRTIAEPNPGFMIQLKAFEKFIFGTVSDCPLVFPKPEISAEQKEILEAVDKLTIAEAYEVKAESE